jgi:type I restriction enzyme M protein
VAVVGRAPRWLSESGIVLVINKAKRHPEEILLVNASKLFEKGRPKNYMTPEHVDTIHGIYREWREEEGISSIVAKGEVAKNDYNLSPSRYVAGTEQEEVVPLEEAVVLLQEAEEERHVADERLDEVLQGLGLGAVRSIQ